MTSTEDVFVSLNRNTCKIGKVNLLKSQADLLLSLKHLHNLRVLQRQKVDLKKKLYQKITSVKSEIETLQEKLPKPKLPKEVKEKVKSEKIKEEVVAKEIKKEKMSPSQKDLIDNELKVIQAKLRALNG